MTLIYTAHPDKFNYYYYYYRNMTSRKSERDIAHAIMVCQDSDVMKIPVMKPFMKDL